MPEPSTVEVLMPNQNVECVGGTRWLFVNANWPSRCPLSSTWGVIGRVQRPVTLRVGAEPRMSSENERHFRGSGARVRSAGSESAPQLGQEAHSMSRSGGARAGAGPNSSGAMPR